MFSLKKTHTHGFLVWKILVFRNLKLKHYFVGMLLTRVFFLSNSSYERRENLNFSSWKKSFTDVKRLQYPL